MKQLDCLKNYYISLLSFKKKNEFFKNVYFTKKTFFSTNSLKKNSIIYNKKILFKKFFLHTTNLLYNEHSQISKDPTRKRVIYLSEEDIEKDSQKKNSELNITENEVVIESYFFYLLFYNYK